MPEEHNPEEHNIKTYRTSRTVFLQIDSAIELCNFRSLKTFFIRSQRHEPDSNSFENEIPGFFTGPNRKTSGVECSAGKGDPSEKCPF